MWCLLRSAFNHFNEDLFKKTNYNTIFKVREPKSTYDNVSRINEHKVDKIYTDLQKSELTFGDLILCMFDDGSNDLQWQDVERRMLEFLNTPEGAEDIPSLNPILSLIDGKSPDEANAKTLFCLHLACSLPVEGREDYASKYYDKKDVIKYLYNELRLFEKSFSIYINSIVNESYKEKARELLLSITEKSTLLEVDDLVFTFNYTNSFNTLNSKISIVNVHGTVKNDKIIFGIDQEKINPNKPIFRFTKTFRQMTETKLASTYEQEILLPKNEVSEIAFFGHSLSELDYSYFQTIFDHYDLYASNILLTF
ncbi:TPA: AbiH family protein [Enterococcus faecalis]